MCCRMHWPLGRLEGIQFPEAGLHLAQQFYTDNTTVILKGHRQNVDFCKSLFGLFHTVSGLKCNWERVDAILLSNNPMPQDLKDLQWVWESPGSYFKLLGIFVGMDGVDRECTVQHIRVLLDKKLVLLRLRPHSFMARVLVVNQVLMGSLWYLLTVWCGSVRELHDIRMVLINFLWAGQEISARHSIKFQTLAISKMEGGVGLISFEPQVAALSARLIRFVMADGKHPLQLLLLAY